MKKLNTLLLGLMVSGTIFAQDESVVFPDLGSTYIKTGAFVDVSAVRRVALGQNSDQVRLLLGNPHFSEGLNSSVWNYAFNLYTGTPGGDYVTCQYQVKYKDRKVNGLYWKDGQCEQLVNAKPAAPIRQSRPVVLSSDGMFSFAKFGLDDLHPMGKQRLTELANQIKTDLSTVSNVSIVGYSDRIGSTQANEALSLARAETVKRFLSANGVPANLIRAQGMGSANPVVNCPGSVSPKVIACLMPNRRIEISVDGNK